MPTITADYLHTVASELGLRVDRFETTRATDADSIGNGNWLIWQDGQILVLRRYHVLHTETDLAYEAAVLRHLTGLGWSVPTPVTGSIRYGERLWAVTRFVPGKPHQEETPEQIEERGALMARLHADLAGLELGGRQGFFRGADLEAMGAFQDWDPGLAALRELSPELADWSALAMLEAQSAVAEGNLLDLPETIVHSDFGSWNLHFEGDRLGGVIDFDLVHPDSRPWELVLARVHNEPGLIDGYQRAAAELGIPLSDEELAAIAPLQQVFRVDMVMAELWSGPRTGTFNLSMIERQLGLTGTPKP